MKSGKTKIYRYNLALPLDMFNELKTAAKDNGITVVELLRKFIKLGLYVLRMQGKPDSTLIIREGNNEKQIIIF